METRIIENTDIKVFVYGTLKRGFANHVLLQDAFFVGTAKTDRKFAMYANAIPYVFEQWQDTKIHGEIFIVDLPTLIKLDCLEGHPVWYTRKQIVVNCQGAPNIAWCYFCQDFEMMYTITQGRLQTKKIEDGNYKIP